MSHPYKDQPNHKFWYKSVTSPAPGRIDPVTKSKIINKIDKVSTMGSCFAQHLAKNIAKAGFNYFVPEKAPGNLSESEALEKNYGIFSARYGNVYTVKQAVQLFDRA